jgi:hypothetical protein
VYLLCVLLLHITLLCPLAEFERLSDANHALTSQPQQQHHHHHHGMAAARVSGAT